MRAASSSSFAAVISSFTKMARRDFLSPLLYLSLLISTISMQSNASTSPYLTPKTMFQNYQKMLQTFKIFIYKQNAPFAYFTTPSESLFFNSLLNSPFVTTDAEQAHLFFVPFAPDLSTRSLARHIRTIRTELPYWNRTLGADHFYLSCKGIGYESDRNLVELKKNSVQVSCFPTLNGYFIPHKDISLPPMATPQALPYAPEYRDLRFLCYVMHGGIKSSSSTLVNEMIDDPDFVVESDPSDRNTHLERLGGSKFCLFEYGACVFEIGNALRFGCVPVVITDRPILDLPFLNVLRWQDIAVVFRDVGGLEELKRSLNLTWRKKHERMIQFGAVANKHLLWNESPQPLDAFNTLMYQLWLKRYTIRYSTSKAGL